MEQNVRKFLRQTIQTISENFKEEMLWKLKHYKIESPIEQIFYIAWQSYIWTLQGKYLLYPQREIQTGDNQKKYRVDFAIFQQRDIADSPIHENFSWGKNLKIAIELDSFTFHEKTPGQFEYEKKRDRALQEQGWRIFRFSGSEVLRDPGNCIVEIDNFLGELESAEVDHLYEEHLKEKRESGDAQETSD